MFLCCLQRKFPNSSTRSFDWKNCGLWNTSLNWAGHFSSQMFSKSHIKILANVGPTAETIASPSWFSHKFIQNIKKGFKLENVPNNELLPKKNRQQNPHKQRLHNKEVFFCQRSLINW